MLFAVGDRAPAAFNLVDRVIGGVTKTFRVDYVTETQNLLYRLNPNTGAPFAEDFITNGTFHPAPPNVTYTAYQPNSSDRFWPARARP